MSPAERSRRAVVHTARIAGAAPAPATDPNFDRSGWWDPGCRAFASLRAVSTFRLELLRQWLAPALRQRIVDLGCGGGLLAVPLAEDGAEVVGVDVAGEALRAAAARAVPRLRLVQASLEAVPLPEDSADLVLLADVLEHLRAPGPAVVEAARLLRPGGHLFVNTINRTLRARLFAIGLGEGLGFIPKGTHRRDWFVRPTELHALATQAGLVLRRRCGESPRLWATLRCGAVQLRCSQSLAVGYAALYQKSVR